MITDARADAEANEKLRQALSHAVADLQLDAGRDELARETVAAMRRRRGAPRGSSLATVSLVRLNGTLQWKYMRPTAAVGRRRGARAASTMVGGEVVHSFPVREVPPNQVIAALEALDNRLTPARGLRRYDAASGTLVPIARPAAGSRMLLLVHGTFSKGDMFLEELRLHPDGAALLAAAAARYDQILLFDHPTLAVSPVLNALDLECALGDYGGDIDVICHSRGGLVVAWWMRMGSRRVGKIVFVGSPLEGTSLAAPARIKHVLNGLANIAGALERTAGTAGLIVGGPLLSVAAGLMSLLGRALWIGARTPVIDAGVTVVAGLSAQSAVSNNQELTRLHQRRWVTEAECFVISSEFEPGNPEESWWRFWKQWRKPAHALAGIAADAIFEGPNDLVVDVGYMSRLHNRSLPSTHIHHFTRNGRVHHCNYFAQPETALKLREWLRF